MNTTLTEKLAKETNGKMWTLKDEDGFVYKARVYYKKGYAEIRKDNKIYFETVIRHNFSDVKGFAENHNLTRVYK